MTTTQNDTLPIHSTVREEISLSFENVECNVLLMDNYSGEVTQYIGGPCWVGGVVDSAVKYGDKRVVEFTTRYRG